MPCVGCCPCSAQAEGSAPCYCWEIAHAGTARQCLRPSGDGAWGVGLCWHAAVVGGRWEGSMLWYSQRGRAFLGKALNHAWGAAGGLSCRPGGQTWASQKLLQGRCRGEQRVGCFICWRAPVVPRDLSGRTATEGQGAEESGVGDSLAELTCESLKQMLWLHGFLLLT